ncbi:MAG: TPM domain-containing protein [Cytophagaceae bacterium]
MLRTVAFFFCVLTFTFFLVADAAAHDDALQDFFPKPDYYVYDFADLLTSEEETAIQNRIASAKSDNSVNIILLIVKNLREDAHEYVYKNEGKWKEKDPAFKLPAVIFIDYLDKDNLIVPGADNFLNKSTAKKIEQQYLKHHIRNGNYADGILTSIDAMVSLKSGIITEADLKKDGQGIWLILLVGLAFFFLIAMPVVQLRNRRKRTISSKKKSLIAGLSVMNSFGANRAGFDAFANSRGIFSNKKVTKGGGGAKGSW